MEEERFRVSVCLQHYYNDRRSRAYISVIPKNKVHWLQHRLRTLFALKGWFFLRSQGHLLHPDEPLSLLRPDDPVEVVPLTEEFLESDEGKTKSNEANCSQSQGSLKSLPFEHTNKKVQNKELPNKEVQMKELQNKEMPVKEMPMPQEDTSDNKLLQMKQQALELLDQFSDANHHYADEPDGISVPTALADVPKRRRRVRRRKRQTSNEESSNSDLFAQEERQSIKVPVLSEESQIGSIGQRKPRLIHSLSPS